MLRSARVGFWLIAALLVAVPGEGGPPARRPPPWLVAVVRAGDGMAYPRFVCAGVVIAHDAVMTASHCIDAVPEGVALQVLRSARGDVCGTSPAVGAPVVDTRRVSGDVAVLLLAPGRATAAVATTGSVPPSGELVAWGWGDLLGRVCVARPVPLRRLDQAACAPLRIDDTSLCATGVGDANTCRGDSGGPVVADGVVVAITSRGIGCLPGAPGAYEAIPVEATV